MMDISLQISAMGRNKLMKYQITKNKYQNISVFVIALLIASTSLIIAFATYGEKMPPMPFCIHYVIVFQNKIVEGLLISDLANCLAKKFEKLNENLAVERPPRKLQRIYPANNVSEGNAKLITSRIIEVIDAHRHLTDLSNELNAVFGFPFLINILLNFQVVTTSFYFVLRLASTERDLTAILHLLLATISCAMLLLLELLAVIKAFEGIRKQVKKKNEIFATNPTHELLQANETATLVHKIWNSHRTKEKTFAAALRIASVKLLHTKLNFSVCGMLPLDMTLMHMVL